jgi:hypothetical protein
VFTQNFNRSRNTNWYQWWAPIERIFHDLTQFEAAFEWYHRKGNALKKTLSRKNLNRSRKTNCPQIRAGSESPSVDLT